MRELAYSCRDEELADLKERVWELNNRVFQFELVVGLFKGLAIGVGLGFVIVYLQLGWELGSL